MHKFISEDDKAFTIQHPDGSKFKVAKKGLSKSVLAKIDGMKPEGYAYGGDVGAKEEAKEFLADMPQEQPQPVMPQMPPNITAAQEGAAAMPAQQAPAPSMAAKPAQPSPMQAYESAIGAQKKATTEIGNINAQQMASQAEIQQKNAEQMERSAADYNAQMTEIAKQNEALKNDVQNGKIEPGKLWNDMSTAQKVGMGVAFVLGGIGQGLMKQGPNQAMAMFNKLVDDDIAAQKINLQKKETLLGQNMQRYRDLGAAEAATRMQLIAVTQAKIAAEAAKSGSPLALQNAKMINAQLDAQLQKDKMTVAAQAAKQMQEKSGQFVPQMGQFAPSEDAAKKINQRIADSNKAVSGLNNLLAMSQVTGRSFSPTMRAKAQTEAKVLQGALREDIVGPGTVSDSDRAMLEDVIADPTVMTAWGESQKARLQALKDIVLRNTNETIRAYGMSPSYGVGAEGIAKGAR